jgi:hypothetical protein
MLALLAFGAIYSTEYLGLSHRWWFEDDPMQYAAVSAIHHPVAIFTDPSIVRHFGSGIALVPMQILSYWVDIRLAGFSPRFAYFHQVCSYLLTLLLFYLVLEQYLPENRAAALVGSLVWALLPATAVVVQFLATRHYLEGLLFTLLALYLAQRLTGEQGRLTAWGQAAVFSAAAVAMLHKEIFPPVVLALLLMSAWQRQDQTLAISVAALAAVYALYRTWMAEVDLHYASIPYLSPEQYVKFLSKLPYTFSVNYGGYCVLALVAVSCGYAAFRRKDIWAPILWLCLNLALSLAVIFPASSPLYGMIRRPDTWYRIVFLLNTIAVGFGTYLAARWSPPWFQKTLALVTLAVLLPGVAKTRALWSDLTASAEREGKFYLNNPDKVILSEQAAQWFLPGLDQMYQVHPSHYVLEQDLATTHLEPGVALWRYTDGHYVPEYK